MTLTTPYSATFYVGDGERKTFPYLFDEVSENFITVIVYNALTGQSSTPTYIVDTDQKQVIFGDDTPAPTADETVCIYRNTPNVQDVPFRTLHGYDAKTLENILSKIVAMIQEIKSNYFTTQVLQGDPWQLDLLSDDDDGATINIDYTAKKLVKGLYFRITDGNLQVSADGSNYITMPKSTDVAEFRQQQTIKEDLTVEYRLQYRVGNTWYNAESNAEATADEAKQIAEEARDIANDAKDIAQDAKDIADTFDDRLTQAESDASNAKSTVDNHVQDYNNPHQVSKAQVGLGNVDNTADLDKPISTATQSALDLKANSADIGNATLTIQKNNTDIDTFTANATVDKTINITVPVNASDVGALPDTTKYTANASMTIDSTTYVITLQLKDQDGNNIGSAQTIDLPLETVVVSGSYDSATKEVVLTLKDGSTIRFSVADLVSGLQSEITAQNPLDADLVDDSTATHKFVSASDKTNWNNHIANTSNPHSVTKAQVGLGNVDNTSDLDKPISTATQTALDGKQATISDLATIRSNAQAGKAASDTIATYGDIVTHDVAEFATAAQGAKADSALQPGDNVSDLLNDAGYLVMSDLTNFVTKNTAQTISGLKTFSADIVLSGTTSIKNTTNGVSYTMLYRDTSGIHVGTSTQALLLAGSNARPKFNNNDIAMLSDVPTAVSQLTNDTGFITNAVNDLQNYTLTSNLATVATTGDYDDLLNKPTIPAAQVNSDWNANSGVAQILNKPTLAAVATSGAYSDLLGTPSLAAVATSGDYDDLLNKPTIPTVNNPTITITQGGVTKGSFTLNQASGDTIELDAGGGGGSSYHPDLFDVKWADHICNDVQWLRADTFSWQSGAVYQAAYQHLEDDIDGKTLQSETIAGTTIQFYLADDGHKICPASEESNVIAIYNATGVAWYYIIDTVNERFKLPRTKFGFTGLRGNVGDYVEAGLPNITGTFNQAAWANIVATGAFSTTSNSGKCSSGNDSKPTGTFDASRCSSIYGNSDTVQPKATEMYLYFYVGNFTQTALENTAGITTEEMNNKVNIGHEVIEFQEPTSANNYTWYRKYADGWVEQGGIVSSTPANITFPVEMADTNYYANACPTSSGSSNYSSSVQSRTTTGAQIVFYNESRPACWQVSGMAA